MDNEAMKALFTLPAAGAMTAQALEAWKKQLDTALRMVEALTEGAMKMHEVQLEAATDTHANAVAAQQAIAKAGDAAEFSRLGSEWAMHNLQHAMGYWRQMFETALETNAAMVKCVAGAQAGFGLPVKAADFAAFLGGAGKSAEVPAAPAR